jgi:serine protease Do
MVQEMDDDAGSSPAPRPDLAHDLAATAGALRQITVQVRTAGTGAGSGIVWRPDGLIVTNAHVARGPRAVVELWDGRTFEARVTARDPRRDLATLQVPAAGLPAATPGDPRALRVGDLVLAMGNPLGVTGALAVGIVHAVEGRNGADGRAPRWIRADVRLAPGNSGGPLADARGRVVGVNTLIAGGLGCAVPTTTVERFLAQTAPGAATPSVARPVVVALGRRRTLGLMLVEVAAGGVADRAGLLIGDVLLGVDGRPFTSPGDLGALIEDGAGVVRLDLVRGGERSTREVTLGEEAPGVRAA